MALFRRGYVRGGIIVLLVVSLVLLWAAPCFAVAIADDILVATVLAFLAASGVTLSFASGGASQSDVVGVMMGKLGEYATSEGASIADLFPAAGAWFANGFINVTQSVGNALSGFLSWLQGSDVGLTDNSDVVIQPESVYLGSLLCYPLRVGTVIRGPSSSAFDVVGRSTFTYTITSLPADKNYYYCYGADTLTNGLYWVIVVGPQRSGPIKFSQVEYRSNGNVTNSALEYNLNLDVNSSYGWCHIGNFIANNQVVSMTTNSSYGSKWVTPDPKSVVGSIDTVPGINIGADTITTLPPVESGYDVVIGSGAIGSDAGTLQGAADDILGHVVDNAGDLSGSLEVVEQGTVVPPGPDDPDQEDSYPVVGLEEIFPFCIPFDLYEFFSVLDAEPVAPSFTWTADFPDALGGPREVTLDFDTPEWNAAARVLRTLELLAFIVGLMVITRKLIRG